MMNAYPQHSTETSMWCMRDRGKVGGYIWELMYDLCIRLFSAVIALDAKSRNPGPARLKPSLMTEQRSLLTNSCNWNTPKHIHRQIFSHELAHHRSTYFLWCGPILFSSFWLLPELCVSILVTPLVLLYFRCMSLLSCWIAQGAEHPGCPSSPHISAARTQLLLPQGVHGESYRNSMVLIPTCLVWDTLGGRVAWATPAFRRGQQQFGRSDEAWWENGGEWATDVLGRVGPRAHCGIG